jgi:SAM-dependent methyltransferase/acyl carrier protein
MPKRSLEIPSSSAAERETANCDAWIYDLVWESKPLGCAPSTSVGKLDEELIAKMTGTRATGELFRVERLTTATQPVYASYILRALQEAGLSPLPTAAFSLEELSQRLRIVPARRRVLGRLLGILIEDGILERTGDRFRFVDFQARPDVENELKKFEAEYPECRTEIKILRRCGKKLSAVLQGGYDPMQLVFADGSIDEAEQIYERSPVCRFFNERAATLIRAAAESIQGRPAQILEIGGGTGATTTSVLDALEDRHFEYCFTDVSPVFLSRARVKFAATPGMSYRVLDIENDPVQQGIDVGKYDLILAANVLHATADLRRTLAHARTMLAPGGILLLVEGTRPDRWLDLTFGLTDGWWRFNDLELRPQHPLVSAEAWARLLKEVGMGSCRTIAYLKENDVSSQQTILVAQVDETGRPAGRNAATVTRQWNILADEFGVGDALHTLLVANGESCELIRRPKTASEIAAEFRRLQAKDPSNVSQEFVYLWGMDGTDSLVSPNSLAKGEELCGKTLVHLIQTLINPAGRKAHLWIATRGAQAAGHVSPEIGGALQSVAWGIGRALGLEVPGLYRGLIDLDPTLKPEVAAANLLAELLSADGEDQVAYRDGERLVARLENSSLKASKKNTGSRIRSDGSYLIVGGLGGVGLSVAKWVAKKNPGHLVLLSRTGADGDAGAFAAERRTAIKEMEALGVNVTVVAGDVASAEDMTILFRRFGQEFPPLRGVFHAATVVHASELSSLTDEAIDTMLRPKVAGTWYLHEHTRTMALDFFLAFSSTTSLLGAKGLAHYAAANQFLDCFALYRRGLGLPMLSVNWGAWDTMRLLLPEEQGRLAEAGLRPMPSEKIFNMFEDLIASSRAQVMIANIDWNVLKPLFETQRARPLLEKLGKPSHTQADIREASTETTASLAQAMMMTPQQRRLSIEAFVLEQAARVLGFRNGELPAADLPLTDLGLDSLMAVDLKNRLQAWLGQELSPTLVFDYPSVSALVEMLETMLWAADGIVESDMAASGKDEIRI